MEFRRIGNRIKSETGRDSRIEAMEAVKAGKPGKPEEAVKADVDSDLKEAVMRDLKDAKKYGKVSVGKRYLFFRGLFQGEYAALDDVVWIYLRQEDTQTSVCCGKATFETYFLMVVFKDGWVKKQRMERKEEAREAMEAVRRVNPAVDVGYTAELREKYCL